ncbi:MAG: hypothetical protein ABIU30_03530 [Ferruginibacter sp.]
MFVQTFVFHSIILASPSCTVEALGSEKAIAPSPKGEQRQKRADENILLMKDQHRFTVNLEDKIIKYPFINYPLSSIHYQLSIIHHQVSSIKYPLSIVHYPLSIIKYPVSSIHHPLSVII